MISFQNFKYLSICYIKALGNLLLPLVLCLVCFGHYVFTICIWFNPEHWPSFISSLLICIFKQLGSLYFFILVLFNYFFACSVSNAFERASPHHALDEEAAISDQCLEMNVLLKESCFFK
ncbi:hypothetical protein HMI54_002587 [Coelomomyces lativittatus]|nr:hypothetical protein HMI54_002587 [Coelomomyces lativittatus]